MNRNNHAASACVVGAAILSVIAYAQKTPISIKSDHYAITNIDPDSFSGLIKQGHFQFSGMPRLHISLTDKHAHLEAGSVEGQLDTKSPTLKTAKLGGGVTGSMDSVSSDGPEHFTFGGSVVKYSNPSGASDQSADLDVQGHASFGLQNQTARRKLAVTGSQGTFQLRKVGKDLGLSTADLDGPVVLDMTMVPMKKGKPTGGPGKGHATASHLSIRRDGTDYVLRLSGGVTITGSLAGQFEGAEITAPELTVQIDSTGVVKEVSSTGATSTKVNTGNLVQ